jgi:hypothetical protein
MTAGMREDRCEAFTAPLPSTIGNEAVHEHVSGCFSREHGEESGPMPTSDPPGSQSASAHAPRRGEGLGERFFLAERDARSMWKHVGGVRRPFGPGLPPP